VIVTKGLSISQRQRVQSFHFEIIDLLLLPLLEKLAYLAFASVCLLVCLYKYKQDYVKSFKF